MSGEEFRRRQQLKQFSDRNNMQQGENRTSRITKYTQQRVNQPTGKNYTAPRGTAHNAKKKKKKANTKLAALILAGIIGVGGISLANNQEANRPDTVNMITAIQQAGIFVNNWGLSEETIELFKKYDEYFEGFDEDAQYSLTEEQVMKAIDEIDDMHFRTVKEKMGSLVGEDPKNIKMYYGFDNADGTIHASVIINEDYYSREVYHNDDNWILQNKNSIPSEFVDIITQLEDLENLKNDVSTDKITKVNAVKRLEKLYKALEQFATGELIKDEKGNISIIHYEDKQVDRNQSENERDD